MIQPAYAYLDRLGAIHPGYGIQPRQPLVGYTERFDADSLRTGEQGNQSNAMDLTAETPETAFAALPVGGGDGRVTVSPDDRWLITSLGGWIQLWPLQAEELLALACQVAGRNLDEDEWEQYFRDNPIVRRA